MAFFRKKSAADAASSVSMFDTYPDKLPDELFERAEYDAAAGENGGEVRGRIPRAFRSLRNIYCFSINFS